MGEAEPAAGGERLRGRHMVGLVCVWAALLTPAVQLASTFVEADCATQLRQEQDDAMSDGRDPEPPGWLCETNDRLRGGAAVVTTPMGNLLEFSLTWI